MGINLDISDKNYLLHNTNSYIICVLPLFPSILSYFSSRVPGIRFTFSFANVFIQSFEVYSDVNFISFFIVSNIIYQNISLSTMVFLKCIHTLCLSCSLSLALSLSLCLSVSKQQYYKIICLAL